MHTKFDIYVFIMPTAGHNRDTGLVMAMMICVSYNMVTVDMLTVDITGAYEPKGKGHYVFDLSHICGKIRKRWVFSKEAQ